MTKLFVTIIFILTTFSGSAVAQYDNKQLADYMQTGLDCIEKVENAICTGSNQPSTLGEIYDRKPINSFSWFKRNNGIPADATKETKAERRFYLMGTEDDVIEYNKNNEKKVSHWVKVPKS
jgi:hypothetical protein